MNRLRLKSSGHASLLLVALVVLALLAGAFLYVRAKQPDVQMAMKSDTVTKQAEAPVPTTKTPSNSVKATEDLSRLPVGDGKLSTTPRQGYVMSCQQSFSSRAAGAAHTGPWFHNTYWDLDTKTTVPGSVSWPQANITITKSGSKRIVSGNGLPVGMSTGTYPIPSSSAAYQYDRNPNAITAQSVSYQLPADPSMATSASCVPMGVIGYMTNGVALFNALDAGGRDAAAHEVQDSCDGHPEKNGSYHFHSLSRCIEKSEGNAKVIGYALDGYGITGNKDADGNVLTTADLDECHGTTSQITWDGKMVRMYHYVLTHDYPYSIGCFRGTPVRSTPPR